MNQRTFNGTGFQAGEIGLGAWQIGGSWGEEIAEAEAIATLHAAVDSGVNFIDTADVYGDGRSESLIGRFLKERSDRLFVATKLGRGGDPGWPGNFALEAMRKHTEASLSRLGVETLDLIQLHCIPTDELRRGEVFEHLRTLRQEGKIRHWGVSVESMEEAEICLDQDDLTSLQIIFNIFRQKPIHTIFSRAKTQSVGIIVRLPLASGLLSGKLSRETRFAETDHRNFNRDGQAFNVGETFAGLPYDAGVDLVDELRPLVPEGLTMAQLALRWCLDHDAVSVVIPGARNPEQARGNAAASDLPPLSTELHQRLSDWYEQRVAAQIRGPY
ncbi:MAG: aldo/keto reductase [Armatimonadetes bacterium]|nr:aldo/keto reductase [Armatimonadota bacterium]